MKLGRVEVVVKLEPGEVPDFRGPYSTKPIRPTIVTLHFTPAREADAKRWAKVGGRKINKDGYPGQVSGEHWVDGGDEWPEWLTEIADRYQPDWEKEGY